MSDSTSALLIFIKNVEKGKVKTRLAATVGEDRALRIYQALLDHTQKVALALAVDRLLFYSDHIELDDNWSNHSFQKFVQQGPDLGQRMLHAFQEAFKNHQKVVIIGSDCASLTPAIVHQAFEQLDHFPFVIGPATDGGYYLLGMKAVEASLFLNMEWSTETVLSTTISRIQSLGKTYHLLPELSDIDFEEDWEQFGWKLEN